MVHTFAHNDVLLNEVHTNDRYKYRLTYLIVNNDTNKFNSEIRVPITMSNEYKYVKYVIIY